MSKRPSVRRPSTQLKPSVVLLAGGAVGGWFALLALLDARDRPFLPTQVDDYRVLANSLSRSSVTLITTVFGCLFFAIPLTANMYTPQIIENFWSSRTNRAVLGLYVFAALNAVWLTAIPAREGLVATTHLGVTLALVMTSLVVLLPYLFSVFRMIDPEAIIARVARNVAREMRPAAPARATSAAAASSAPPGPDPLESTGDGRRLEATSSVSVAALVSDDESAQDRLERRITDLGAVLSRTIERGEREFAVDAVGAVVEAGRRWLRLKEEHPASFFAVDSRRLHGFSPAAIRLVNAERTWVDLVLMRQLARAFASALTRAPDVISAVGRGLRHYAVAASDRGDEGVVRLALRFVNNCMRDAVKGLDVHAIYDLLYQTSELALQIWPRRPEHVVAMLRRLDQYGRRASEGGAPFAHALVGYDFGRVLAAVDDKSPRYAAFLEAFLAVGEGRPEGLHRLFVKVRLVTAARLAAAGRVAAAETVLATLARTAPPITAGALKEVLATDDPWFWEVTDRQENLDWLSPPAREWLVRRMGEGPR